MHCFNYFTNKELKGNKLGDMPRDIWKSLPKPNKNLGPLTSKINRFPLTRHSLHNKEQIIHFLSGKVPNA